MKTIITLVTLVCFAFTAHAGFLVTDSNATKIQGFAPNGLASAALTVNSVTYDFTAAFVAFSVYSPADCYVRITKTSSKAGSVLEPIVGAQWNTIVVNPYTPFATFSGCTNGFLRRM